MPKPSNRPATVVRPAERRERLALNLFDAGGPLREIVRQFAGLLDLRREAAVWVDRASVDETAAPFACSLIAAAVALDVIRSEARRLGDPPPRAYLNRTGAGAWQRLPAAAVLTAVEDGRPVLAAEWFPRAVESEPYVPPPDEPITFGAA